MKRASNVHLVTPGAMDKVNLAHILHNFRARYVLQGERVRKHLFHCEYGDTKLLKCLGNVSKFSRNTLENGGRGYIFLKTRFFWSVDVNTSYLEK
jgi:hypothetical protein